MAGWVAGWQTTAVFAGILASTSSKSIWLAGWLGGRQQLFSLGSAGVKIINAACPAKVYGCLGGWVAGNNCFRWDLVSTSSKSIWLAGWLGGRHQLFSLGSSFHIQQKQTDCSCETYRIADSERFSEKSNLR